MAIEPARLPPLEAIRNELQVLRRSPMVALSGRAALVDMVDAYIVAHEARLEAIEARIAALECTK